MQTHHLLACLLVCLPTWAQAQSNAERYMLQERCGKQAAASFKAEWGGNITNTDKGQTIANYQNHYGERLNKCFYLEISETFEKSRSGSFKSLRLYDINENKEYATFMSGAMVHCVVDEETCHSEQEFMQLIKKFMEN